MVPGRPVLFMNLVKSPLAIGRVLTINKLTSVIRFMNMGWFLFMSGVFPSSPVILPTLELKSPIARTMNPCFLSCIASFVIRWKRSSFHLMKESLLVF
jgi:hypothetical protein